jgi:hypothetical protein
VTIRTDPLSIEQVETLLKSQDSTESNKDATDCTSEYIANTVNQALPNGDFSDTAGNTQARSGGSRAPGDGLFQDGVRNGNNAEQDSWEMIGLGLEEPLPPQEVMNDL